MAKFPSQRSHLLTIPVAFLDFLSLQAAVLIGYWLWIAFPWHGHYQLFSDYAEILWILPPIGLVIFSLVGLYKPEMGVIGVEEQMLIFKAVWIIYFVTFAFSFFYRHIHFSRLSIFYSIFVAIAFLSAERFFVRRVFEWLHKRGVAVRRALIYGAGYHGQRLERWIRQSPKLGIQVVGYLDDEIERLTKKPESPPWIGGFEDLRKIVRQKNISLFFVAHRKLEDEGVMEIFQTCRDIGIPCWIIPRLYHFHVERAQLTNIGGIPLVAFQEGWGRRPYEWAKRVLDILCAFLLLVLTAPLFLLIAGLIRMTSAGPIFFKQIRIGCDGHKFSMLKFRTLNAGKRQDEISPELRAGSKPVHGFGAFLRRSGLDELPQLIHVFCGEMSLIGPRPEMPFIVERYGPLERERLTVKPGITGLWQISEDRKRLLIHENMDYDLYYVEHLSFNMDLAIVVKTFTTVFKRFL